MIRCCAEREPMRICRVYRTRWWIHHSVYDVGEDGWVRGWPKMLWVPRDNGISDFGPDSGGVLRPMLNWDQSNWPIEVYHVDYKENLCPKKSVFHFFHSLFCFLARNWISRGNNGSNEYNWQFKVKTLYYYNFLKIFF